MEEKHKSFWTTLPGTLTGLAALITAIGGIFLIQRDGQKENNGNRSPLAKIEGAWTFTWHSTLTGNSLKGTLVLQPDEGSGINSVKGHMETFNSDWQNFSSDVVGTFLNNELKLYRETGIQNVTQLYDLIYYSQNKISGTFHNKNGTNMPGYEDNGTLELAR